MLRLPALCERTALGRSTLYRRIEVGLFTPPCRLFGLVSAWPAAEVDALLAAGIAGASTKELRALVKRLVAARGKATESRRARTRRRKT